MDAALIRELMVEEGTRLYAYDDATGEAVTPGYRLVGHCSLGVGRALDTNGISTSEAQFLLNDDLTSIDNALSKYDWWTPLSPVRQFIIVSMTFNMGIDGLLSFSNMIAALFHSNYELAADEMLLSKWGAQLPLRSHRLARAMRLGYFPPGA